LLLKGKFSIIESVTGVPVDALAADFWIPDTIQTADYWIGAAIGGSYSLLAYTPDDGGAGDFGFNITRVKCSSHSVCASTRYCDTEGFCYDCSACATALDAFDGVCPTKCGGT
jgi:hypothetical protein